MSGKRSRKTEDEVPRKKRHVEVSNENRDISNFAGPSQPVTLTTVENIELKSGKIIRIHLKNFMCHTNFAVDLNKNTNVFVGLNGSGKSAILAALTIGLGGNASSTARSTNLRDLVKQGTTTATIEITISNDGIDAFEQEEYGKAITVVRTISNTGSASNIQLKSASGRIIAKSRKELNKLTLCLNIQVDNPVLILNQDAARSFLKECDPKKLYTLFMKATQLEVIVSKLHSCLSCANTSKAQLDHLNRTIEQCSNEVAIIQAKREKLQSVARLQKDIDRSENELIWLKVSEEEAKLTEIKKKLDKVVDQISNIKEMIKNRDVRKKQMKDKICDLGTNFTELNNVVKEKDQIAEACREDFEKLKDVTSNNEGQHRNLIERSTLNDQNIAQLEADIAERDSNPLNARNAQKENEEKISLIESKKEDAKLHLANARRDHDQFSETLSDSREKVDGAKQQGQREQAQVEKFNNQKRQMEGSSKNVLSVYGSQMPKLLGILEDLHRKRKFTEMPRGPLGRYIEVPETKYKSAVENILDTILTAFYVSCDKDRMLLTQVLKDFPDCSRFPIITGSFTKQAYDVRNGIVRLDGDEGRVLMDVMKVSDPIVLNCLIDQRKIETIVLTDSTETAITLTQDSQNVPQNLTRVVLLNPLSEYYPAPNYRSYAMNEKPTRFIQTSYLDVMVGIDQQKRVHETKYREIMQNVKQLGFDVKEKEKLVEDKKKLMNELNNKIFKYNRELEELKSIEYPPENDIEYLRGELADLLKKQKSYNKKIQVVDEIAEKERGEAASKESELKKCRDEARKTRNEMIKIQKEIDQTQQQLTEMDTELKLKANQIADHEAQITIFNRQVNEQDKVVEALARKTKGERIVVDKTEEAIINSIRSNMKRIEAIRASNDNIEDVEMRLRDGTEKVAKMKKIQQVLDEVLKKLEIIRQSRFDYIRRLRQHMSLRCKHKFSVLMELRNYTAEVLIDHKDRTLELKVIPRDASVAGAVSNTKSLSGGERSYSTVAFLISLWSCVDHPFYFLDEYDVFSDEHNRHMMTRLLFNEADKKRNRQFGFLTPQDFSNIQASDVITIHKLHDPERSSQLP